MEKIFLRLTIKGDNLNLQQIVKDIPLAADTYVKGSIAPLHIPLKKYKPKAQKTNRWVYSTESQQNENLNAMITRISKELSPWIDKIKEYTKSYSSILDIIAYANSEKPMSKYSLKLSRKSLSIVNSLGARLCFTVWDW